RLGEHALPQGARLLEPDARVDDRPSRTVVEEPEIDVVEAERERHAEPLDAREHVDGRARSGRLRPRMIGGHGAQSTLRPRRGPRLRDRKSTRLNSSHGSISYA